MRIRSHLVLLAVGAMLPVLAFAVLLSIMLLDRERSSVESGAMDRARAMMTGVDAQLRGSISAIEALAASSALAAGDLRAFHTDAVRVLATQPTWLNVTLVRSSGEKVVDVTRGFGEALPRILDPASIARAVSTMRPTVGDVDAATQSDVGIPIRVPVLRDGAVLYVVTAVVRPDSFESLIREQRMPEGWISGIVDSDGRFVARVPPRPAGQPASAAYRAAVLQAPEGWSRGVSVEGRDVFSAHAVSEFSAWSVGLAIPAEIVLAGARRTALLIGLGVLSSIAVAMGVVVVSGRRIARPIVSLASTARSIGTGMPGPMSVRGDVQEVSEVAAALQDADVAVRERESLIQREKDALQAADRAKDEFIAALSHELRNPLAAMTAASHILRVAEPTNPSAFKARGVIERQTRHMSRMIEDLLDVSRVIMGKANLTIETFDLAQLAETTAAAWHSAERLAPRTIRVAAEPAWACADRTRTEQILSNLLDNAVKFTPPGTLITVTVAKDRDQAVLSVSDDGPGIAPDLQPRVFDLFVQGEQGVGRSRGGMGVGLTLVKRLAQLQGGSVCVASRQDGTGTVFTVRLPAAATPLRAHPSVQLEERRASPRRILLVEDNVDTREMLRQVLETSGHQVWDAADGVSGVALALERRPDIAIVDIGLPDISGYEVARRIRAQCTDGPVLVALTGYGQPEDRKAAFDAGFDIHLVKPITSDQLDGAIADVTRPAATLPARVAD